MFEIHTQTWVKVKVKGKAACPECGHRLVVVAALVTYAVCPKCGSYFVDKISLDSSIALSDAMKAGVEVRG